MLSESALRWQCRRGVRELDVLLTRYLEDRYRSAPAEEKSTFERLLTLSDPQLIDYLLNARPVEDADLDALITSLRGCPSRQ